MPETVGIKEFKARLSHYLERVKRGERFVITSRGEKIAELHRVIPEDVPEHIRQMMEAGLITPRGAPCATSRLPYPYSRGTKPWWTTCVNSGVEARSRHHDCNRSHDNCMM